MQAGAALKVSFSRRVCRTCCWRRLFRCLLLLLLPAAGRRRPEAPCCHRPLAAAAAALQRVQRHQLLRVAGRVHAEIVQPAQHAAAAIWRRAQRQARSDASSMFSGCRSCPTAVHAGLQAPCAAAAVAAGALLSPPLLLPPRGLHPTAAHGTRRGCFTASPGRTSWHGKAITDVCLAQRLLHHAQRACCAAAARLSMLRCPAGSWERPKLAAPPSAAPRLLRRQPAGAQQHAQPQQRVQANSDDSCRRRER